VTSSRSGRERQAPGQREATSSSGCGQVRSPIEYHRPHGALTIAETDAEAADDALDVSVAAHASVETARVELGKLAENVRYRAECQITACGFWGNFQLLVSGAAAVGAAVAGASAFSKHR